MMHSILIITKMLRNCVDNVKKSCYTHKGAKQHGLYFGGLK